MSDGVKSDLLEVECGVRQGWTEIILIYIKDFFNVLVYSNLYCSRMAYNNDICIFYSADYLELLRNIISQELNKLRNWLAVNQLALNINNSNYMIFG